MSTVFRHYPFGFTQMYPDLFRRAMTGGLWNPIGPRFALLRLSQSSGQRIYYTKVSNDLHPPTDSPSKTDRNQQQFLSREEIMAQPMTELMSPLPGQETRSVVERIGAFCRCSSTVYWS